MSKSKFAIVDCNNFFVSCERIFQPKLNNVPVIVLSNNDGCAIARSNEAKKIGIQMADPLFKIKGLVKKYNVKVFSSNFSLYNDISNRIMNILFDMAPDVQVYSIDEAFLDLTSLSNNYNLIDFCQNIVKTIAKYTEIPVSIGIGPTKTLAKLANNYCKRQNFLNNSNNKVQASNSVFEIDCIKKHFKILNNFDVQDVWGIGRNWKKKLNSLGIYNVWQLINTPEHVIEDNFNIVLRKTIQELKGVSTISLEETGHTKQILVSRSFKKTVQDIAPLKEAVAIHTTKASEKLRREQVVAKNITVFMHTNMFSNYAPRYRASFSTELDCYTSDTRKLIRAALFCVDKIYKSGYSYKKAGIILNDLILIENLQLDLFLSEKEESNANALMQTIDLVNSKIGKSSLFFAACGIKNSWKGRSNLSSKIALSCWDKLPIVYTHEKN